MGIGRWRRWVSRAWRRTISSLRASDEEGEDGEKDKSRGELAFLPERTCPICYQGQNPAGQSEAEILGASASGGIIGSAQTDVVNPYETMPCGCLYCFVCIAEKLEAEEGEGWICLRCAEIVKQCRPWNGDVLEAPLPSSKGKNVGFVDDESTQESNEWASVGRDETDDTSVDPEFEDAI